MADVKTGYSADDMTVLEGLEAVRKRPGMYIGSTDHRGLQHTLWEIVDNSVDEALAGHASRIDVYLHDDNSIEVHDDGRGIPTDVNTKTGLTGVEIAYLKLHGGGKFGGSGYAASGGLHGVGAAVVNALSVRLAVEVDRVGKTHRIEFRRGEPGRWKGETFTPKAGLHVVGKTEKDKTGTRVRYWPDPHIFEAGSTVDLDRTLERAKQTAFLAPGLTLVVHDLRDAAAPQVHEFNFDGGIRDFVDSFAAGEQLSPPVVITGNSPYTETIDVLDDSGELVNRTVERSMGIEVALTWCNDFDADIRSFVNIIRTPKGGTHLDGFERSVTKVLREQIKDTRGVKTAADGVSKDDVLEGLKAVVLVRIAEPQFEGQTKEILGTAAAAKAVADVVTAQLSAFFADRRTKNEAKKIIEKVARASVTREKLKHQREARRRASALESASSLPAKLADCNSSTMEGTELFIVEGDSAGGTVKAARDSETQALLPLRGKILNVQKVTSLKKILANAEVAAIISAIGCGVGKDCDPEARRYEKIVNLQDADSDGAHIRTLVLGLLFKLMRPLFDAGHIYAAIPPLYRIKVKGSSEYLYCFSEDERVKLVASLAKKGKQVGEINRFKGLGEMSADAMSLVIDRDKRTLRRITVDDGAAAEAVFDLLMGTQVDPRREWIVANALAVDPDDLDLH